MYEREDYTYAPLHLNRLTRPNISANMVVSPEFTNPMIPQNPNVKLKKLAFYDILDVLVKPSTLSPANNSRQQEKNFNFMLTPQHATGMYFEITAHCPNIHLMLMCCFTRTGHEP